MNILLSQLLSHSITSSSETSIFVKTMLLFPLKQCPWNTNFPKGFYNRDRKKFFHWLLSYLTPLIAHCVMISLRDPEVSSVMYTDSLHLMCFKPMPLFPSHLQLCISDLIFNHCRPRVQLCQCGPGRVAGSADPRAKLSTEILKLPSKWGFKLRQMAHT